MESLLKRLEKRRYKKLNYGTNDLRDPYGVGDSTLATEAAEESGNLEYGEDQNSSTVKTLDNGVTLTNQSNTNVVASLAGRAGEGMKDSDPTTADEGASFVTGAAQGASYGSLAGPYGAIAGTIIGGIVGASSARTDATKARGRETKQRQVEASNDARAYSSIRDAYESNLKNKRDLETKAQYLYKNGGDMNSPLYNKLAIGGNTKVLSSDAIEIEGNTHEEGGVKFPELGVELEDNETAKGDFVFSDDLGFADKHKTIAKQKGKVEKELEKTPYNKVLQNTLERLEGKEQNLMVEQESLKAKLGIDSPSASMKKGGKISSTTGLETPDLYGKEKSPSKEKTSEKSTDKKTMSPRTFSTYTGGGTLSYLDTEEKARAALDARTLPSSTTPEELQDLAKTYNISYTNDTIPAAQKAGYDLGPGSSDELSNYGNSLGFYTSNYIEPVGKKSSPAVGYESFKMASPMENSLESQVPDSPPVDSPKQRQPIDMNLGQASDYTSTSNFYDNIVNARLIKEMENTQVPLRDKLGYNPLKLDRVNYDAAKTEADQQSAAFNKGVGQSSMSTNSKQALKASSLGQRIGAKNRIIQSENLQNTQIGNREKSYNTKTLNDIINKNKEISYQNEMSKVQAKDDIRREKSAQASNLTEDFGNIARDVKASSLGRDQQALNMNTSDPRAQSYLAVTSPEELKRAGYSQSQIDKWAKAYDEKAYMEYRKELQSKKDN